MLPRSLLLLSLMSACTTLAACGSSFVASKGGRVRADDATRTTMPLHLADGMGLPHPSPDAQPAATFPVILAVASSHTGTSRYVRDVEQGVDLTALKQLPGVTDIVVLPSSTPRADLYTVARSAGAEMLVVYDVSPARSHRGTSVPGLGVLTLGAFPNEYEKAYANASATFVDTQTGFVYATAEVTSSSTEIQNAWQRSDNTVYLKAQRAALRDLLKECRGTWKTVHARFASAGE